MRASLQADLLDIWDLGRARGHTERGLLLLALAAPDEPAEALPYLPVGERDRRLLAWRDSLFGARLIGRLACAACGAQLEIDCGSADLRAAPDPGALNLSDRGYDIALRLPDSHDLLAAAAAPADAAAALLFRRCIASASFNGVPIEADALPADFVESAGQRLNAADPLADPRFAMTCVACGHGWEAPFDASSFIWAELETWSERMLRTVHALAATYGWSEAEILRLSPARRQRYLEMVNG